MATTNEIVPEENLRENSMHHKLQVYKTQLQLSMLLRFTVNLHSEKLDLADIPHHLHKRNEVRKDAACLLDAFSYNESGILLGRVCSGFESGGSDLGTNNHSAVLRYTWCAGIGNQLAGTRGYHQLGYIEKLDQELSLRFFSQVACITVASVSSAAYVSSFVIPGSMRSQELNPNGI
ncbi:hypothetical protein AVEN_244747-1 [Araneus ventricosus]|uniref:Uncharacterized protein n=1 Tax=Araneus ventricosus TaxID=182803 RepID=A0A4Y2BUH2_ARAVE|nr:hypothetical protein AVEN_244747-1 [Araneus ventricosus]